MAVFYESYYGVSSLGSNDYLMHHGIKGMKWGVRRYQNADGSLTAAGRAKYLTSDGRRFNEKGRKRLAKEEKKLKKLKDRADIGLQKQKAAEYDKRATKAMAVSVGALLASGGFAHVVRKPLGELADRWIKDKVGSDHTHFVFTSENKKQAYDEMVKHLNETDWATNPSRRTAFEKNFERYDRIQAGIDAQHEARGVALEKRRRRIVGLEKARDVATLGLLGASAVAGGVAAYNHIQSSLAKKRVTEIGHAKVVEKYKKQAERVKKLRASVKLSDLRKAG